jgi:hypothetical protein
MLMAMVLVRTHTFDTRVDQMLIRLAAESGHWVGCVVDETRGSVDCRRWPKVAITAPACTALGLFCPPDFPWRCGDYGLYLARMAFPNVTHFWMIENDLELRFSHAGDFFSRYERAEADFIAAYLGRRFPNWYWHHVVERRYVTVYGCLFPIVRLSVRALDHLLKERQSESRMAHESTEWPNDEAFVACELVSHGFRCRDLNSFGRRFCTRRTLSFRQPLLLSELEGQDPDNMLYHPVLSRDAFERKIARVRNQIRPNRSATQLLRTWKWAAVEKLHAYDNRKFWRNDSRI